VKLTVGSSVEANLPVEPSKFFKLTRPNVEQLVALVKRLAPKDEIKIFSIDENGDLLNVCKVEEFNKLY
jgi:hypothetical protein